MDSVKIRSSLIPALLTIVFFGLCLYFAKKAQQGPWHAESLKLWEKEEWHKLRALGENLIQIGQEDVESFYLAMLASQQIQDPAGQQRFASYVSNSGVLSLKLEKEISKSYRPDSLRKKIEIFRTRIIFGISTALFIMLIFSFRRAEPYQLAPALISAAGIVVLLL